MTDAAIGYGSTFELGDGAEPEEAFTEIAEVFDITPPNESTDTIDATHMKSPGANREFIFGLTDPGEVSFEMNFLPGSPSEQKILAARAARKRVGGRINFPKVGAAARQRWEFGCLVLGYEPAMPNDDKMTATVTCKVSGSIVRGAAPAAPQ
jgi:hypothetical protein